MARPEGSADLANRLHSVAIHLLRRVRRQDVASGLGPSRLSALSVIGFGGPLSLGSLAGAEQVSAPTMSRVVAALEEAGLVERQPDPADGRRTLLRATPRGMELLREGQRRRTDELAELLGDLDEAERAALDRAIGGLERLLGGPHS
jgi:DNA-binding MarR family transcriptional regulator